MAAQSDLEGKPCPITSSNHDDWKPDHRQHAILNLATKLPQTPRAVDETDLQSVREVGITDRGILAIVLITSYFCFVNRIALGLGVTTNAEEREGFWY